MIGRRPLAVALVGSMLCAALASAARAAPPPAPAPAPPAPPGAPTPAGPALAPGAPYANKDLGLAMEGPSGWKLTASSQSAPRWQALATFNDAMSGSVSVLSVRKAAALTLAKLRAEITKSYADDKSFTVTSITDLPSNGRRPLSGLLVDATQVRPGDPAPAGPAGLPPPPPPAPVTWRVNAAYFLGGEYEYLLYTQTKATLFARLQPAVAKMIDGFTLRLSSSQTAARGEGTFRDESAGFSCQYPGGYGVRLPERTLHLVEFAPATAGPVLGVYHLDTAGDLDAEATALVDYYTGAEVGGEATASRIDVAGRPATLVTAKARVSGKDEVFFVAVVKRSTDGFRIRCAADATQEAEARAVFEKFVKSFVLASAAAAPAATTDEK